MLEHCSLSKHQSLYRSGKMSIDEGKGCGITCQEFEGMITKYLNYSSTKQVFSRLPEFEEHYCSCEYCLETVQLVANDYYSDGSPTI